VICSEYDIVVDLSKWRFTRSRRVIVSLEDFSAIIIVYVAADSSNAELVSSTDSAGLGLAR
jgi:hypothetical protein